MTSKGSSGRYRMVRQSARGVGFVALVFSLTVAVLLTLDWTRSGVAETVRSDVLEQALALQDAQMTEFVRNLDLLARRAYFNSFTFRQGGMLLLVIGLLITAGCFGLAWRMSLFIPDPRGLAEGDPSRTDRLTVAAVLATGVVLLLTAAGLEWSRGASVDTDRALRKRLTNTNLQPGEVNVCPCRRGASQDELDTQWPFLRGPLAVGRASASAVPPLTWNGETGQNIKWVTDVDYPGFSSPVVWGKRLFVTTGDAVSGRRVLAYDTDTGALLWDTFVEDGEKGGARLPQVDEETGFGASTPACDDKHVYAIFSTGDVVAIDHDGNIVWQVYLGRPKNSYGHASSLIYSGEMLLVQWDHEEYSRMLALDTHTGKTIWETPRALGMSWATPMVMPVCDKLVLLVHAYEQTWGMELATGKKLWQVKTVGGEVAPSLSWEGDVWVAANCYSKMLAFRMPPEGEPEKLWEWDDGYLPDVSSPLIYNGLVFYAAQTGDVACHDLADGKQVWVKEINEGFYASPIVAVDKLYVVDKKGVFRVFTADREGKELAVNPMGDVISATPAFVGNRIYIRSQHKLWCVE